MVFEPLDPGGKNSAVEIENTIYTVESEKILIWPIIARKLLSVLILNRSTDGYVSLL